MRELWGLGGWGSRNRKGWKIARVEKMNILHIK
jgi:hypothetical protein